MQEARSGTAPSASGPSADLFGNLNGSAEPRSWPTTKVFEKDGIVVEFDFSMPEGRPTVTDIRATYSNTGASTITNFSLQVLACQPSLGACLTPPPPFSCSWQSKVFSAPMRSLCVKRQNLRALQAAVPKFMQLKLDPASGNSLAPGGSVVTQQLHVNNSQHGVKPLVLRLRIGYSLDGASKTEQVEVKNLPAGL